VPISVLFFLVSIKQSTDMNYVIDSDTGLTV